MGRWNGWQWGPMVQWGGTMGKSVERNGEAMWGQMRGSSGCAMGKSGEEMGGYNGGQMGNKWAAVGTMVINGDNGCEWGAAMGIMGGAMGVQWGKVGGKWGQRGDNEETNGRQRGGNQGQWGGQMRRYNGCAMRGQIGMGGNGGTVEGQ